MTTIPVTWDYTGEDSGATETLITTIQDTTGDCSVVSETWTILIGTMMMTMKGLMTNTEVCKLLLKRAESLFLYDFSVNNDFINLCWNRKKKPKELKRSSILCQLTINSSHLLICLFLAEYFYLSKLLIRCLLLNININLNVLFFSSLSVESSVEEWM